MDETPQNLRNSLFDLTAYDDQIEDELAAILQSTLERKSFEARSSVSVWNWSLENQKLKFEQNLIRFARNRRISFVDSDWRQRAVLAAAYEHKELDPTKRPRGRPASKSGAGLIPIEPDDGRNELTFVTAIKKAIERQTGKPPSWAKACRVAVMLEAKASGISLHPDEREFHSRVHTLRTRVSEQRTSQKNRG